MLSISPGMSAGQAAGYFSREDYYVRDQALEDNSRWYGEGANAMGLFGPVRKEELCAVCSGLHPATGEQLVAPQRSRDKATGRVVKRHRAGNDLTFSSPKTVGIASMLGVEGIKDAHRAAVTAVLEYQEEHYALYRSRDGIRNGGLVVAGFDHFTSRNLDPQLHTHCLFMNMIPTAEGEWKANWNRTMFQDQKSLGLLYRQELAHELQESGFEIVITDRSQMFFELKAIDPKLVEYFSSRRKAIEQQVALWRTEGKFVGVPHARLFEMAALETRDKKREVTREDVEGIFELGFKNCGTTSHEVKRELERSHEIALQRIPEVPEYSASEVISLSVQRLIEKEAVLDRARILDQAVLISGGKHSIRELNLAVGDDTTGVQRLGSNGRGREYYTTAGMRELELGNQETIRGLKQFRTVTNREELGAFLRNVEVELGVPLTAGQQKQIENEVLGDRPVDATEGKAGAGKTFSLKVIERFNEEVLRPQGREHYTIDVAYTARAAQEMSSATGREAYTIDTLLNAYGRGEVALQRQKPDESVLRVMGKEIPLHEGVQLVIRGDEASFVGAKQGRHLLKIVKDLQDEGVQVKLHLIGDTRQMQAIQSGGIFRQALDLEKEGLADVAHLDEIRRQRDPGLLEIARTLNREDRLPGENASDALKALELKGEVVLRERHEELVAAAVERYQEEARRPSRSIGKAASGEKQSVLLITITNADRNELNLGIREARVRACEIEEGKPYRVLAPAPQGVTADRYRKGDQVMFSGYRGEDGKMQRWGARLNTIGTVTGIDPERNRVTVSYSFTAKDKNGDKVERTVTKQLPAAEMAGRVTVYREEERNFSAGDRIVTLKNDRELGVQNGSLGTVLSIDESCKAVVGFGAREVTLDLDRYRHIDHAYAVTIHKSQGATVEHAIWFAPVRGREVMTKGWEEEVLPRRESFGRASFNALNVAVTRAQYGASIFTNSLSGLTREVEHLDEKTSSLRPGFRVEGKTGPAQSTGRPVEGPSEKMPESDFRPGGRILQPGRDERVTQKYLAPEMEVGGTGKLLERDKTKTVFGAGKFDRGVALGKRLDELARVTQPAKHLPDDILPKLVRVIAPGKEIVKQMERGPVKEIDLDFGK